MPENPNDPEVSAEMLADIVENSPDYIGISAADGKILYFNDAFKRLLPARLIGRPIGSFRITDFHPPKIGQMLIEEAVPEAVKHGFWQGRTELLDSHGNAFPVTQIIVAHLDDAGKLLRLSSIMRDIRPLLRSQDAVPAPAKDGSSAEVSRLNQVMVDRELRIADLKRENEELHRKLAERGT